MNEFSLRRLDDIPVSRLDDFSITILDDIQSSMDPNELVNRVVILDDERRNA
jgi:hypothetical protein